MAKAGLLERMQRTAPAAPLRADIFPLHPHACSRRQVCRGESLCSAGESFRALYVVHAGNFKSFVASRNGLIQVTGFQIAGDVVGLDCIDTGLHQSDVIALMDSDVFVLPFAQCEKWSRESAYAQHLLMRTLAREASRSQQHMLGLGTMRAERRMALFLLDLSQRYQHLGWSRSQFLLSMLRQDIGSYLGLTLETVSRLLSRMQREGVLQVQGKSISLLDFPALWRLAGTTSEHHQPPALDPIVDREGNLAYAH